MTFSTEPDEERAAFVRASLRENNLRFPEMRGAQELYGAEREPLEIYELDGDTVIGGLVGQTWVGWLHIDLLWVRDQRTGLGTRLMARAEEIARERGCLGIRLETWSFQAPDFYRRCGYEVAGEVHDHPPGAVDYTFVKRL